MRKILLLLCLASVASAQQYNQTQIPYSTLIGTSGATIPLLNGANTWSAAQTFTGAIIPTSTVGITGTTAADSPAAGSVGQVYSIHCPAPTTATVTMTIANPTVVTWSTHPFTAVGAANYTCPINFTNSGGALPSHVVAGTNYYIIGSSLSGDTFQISDTSTHALAGTSAVSTLGDSQSGTQSGFMGNLMSTGTTYVGAAMSLVAGDWDCSGVSEYGNLTSITATQFYGALNLTGAATIVVGQYGRQVTSSVSYGAVDMYMVTPVLQDNISSTTAVAVLARAAFSGGTQNGAGFLRCRRMR